MEVWKTTISTRIRMSYKELKEDLSNGGLKTTACEPDLERSLGEFSLRLNDIDEEDIKWSPNSEGLMISEEVYRDIIKKGFFSRGFDGPVDTCHELEIVVIDYPKTRGPRDPNPLSLLLYSPRPY